MDSNYEFKGMIVDELIDLGLGQKGAKKLICIGTVSDATANVYSSNTQWYLETNPEKELHNLFYDLFLFAYDLKLPTFYSERRGYRRSGFRGKKYEPIVRDLFNFTPTFKTKPDKDSDEDQPTIEFVLGDEDWLKKAALRLYFDLEGFISTKFIVRKRSRCVSDRFQFQFIPRLGISVSNRRVARELKELAEDFSISMSFLKDKRTWSGISAIDTENKEDVFNFKELGGFLTNVKESKSELNEGTSKQAVLEACCDVLESRRCSKHFPSREKADSYRNSFKETFQEVRE